MALKRSKDPLTEIQNCLQKRDYKGALPYFLALLAKNTKNTQIRLRYADTLVLAGSKKESIKQYRIVADELAEAGFIVRAIAINKKIVQLDPTQVAVHEKLAAMNEERSKTVPRTPLAPHLTSPGLPLMTPERAKPEAPKTVPKAAPPVSTPVLSPEESWDMEFGSEAPLSNEPASARSKSSVDIEIDAEPVSEPALGFGGLGRAEVDDPFAVPGSGPSTSPSVEDIIITETPELELELLPDEEDVPTARSIQVPLPRAPAKAKGEPTPVFGSSEDADVVTIRSKKPPREREESSPGFAFVDDSPGSVPSVSELSSPFLLEDVQSQASSSDPLASQAADTHFDLEEPSFGSVVASHFHDEEESTPEIDVEPEVDMADVSDSSPSPAHAVAGEEPAEPAEFVLDFDADEAADGANPLVGLIGEDVDALIDNIISDVHSSGSWSAPRTQAPTKIPLFSDLTTEEFIDVALMLSRRSVKAGAVVVREGDPGDSMFIVSTGEVTAFREENGRQAHLATLKDGDFFGEMAVLSGEPRRATVVAVKNSELLELSRDHLLEIFDRHPHVEAKIRLAHDERAMT